MIRSAETGIHKDGMRRYARQHLLKATIFDTFTTASRTGTEGASFLGTGRALTRQIGKDSIGTIGFESKPAGQT